MSIETVTHFVGNTSPALVYQFLSLVNGVATPFPFPAGTDVRFYLREASTSTYRVNGALATILNPTAVLSSDTDAGIVRYDWQAADVALPAGEFVGWLKAIFSVNDAQDTPEFSFHLTEHFAVTPTGLYTNPGALKDFTGFDELKTASDEYLATNVIPRAEAWLQAWGPFVSVSCPQLALAANVLAESIFLRVNPSGANRALAGGYKSESIGNYSYTLGDVAGADASTPWEDLLNEITSILTPCLVAAGGGVVLGTAGGSNIFPPLPAYAIDSDGYVSQSFDVRLEIEVFRGYLDAPSKGWGVWR